MPARYDLLAIDLDGTLLDSHGRVSESTLGAIGEARGRGLRIVICTGRGLAECRHVLERIAHHDPVVVAGGAIIADPASGQTLHRFNLAPDLVARTSDRLLEAEHPVMVLKDPAKAGYDYLMLVGERRLALDPVTTWWVSSMNISHRFAARASDDPHPGHTVRLGVCGRASRLEALKRDIESVCGEQTTMHHFGAVVVPEAVTRATDGEKRHILEVFPRDASKWSAIRWLAARDGIEESRIAAIGDEVNDVSMVRGAALGIAMGNAVDSVASVASRRTRSNDEDGVAHAIDRILEGAW
jgi:HAD superfamily hydrolase (TIGR01484 family)